MGKIGDKQFHAMCNMWGVNEAVKAAKRIGMTPTQEQIDAAVQEEKNMSERWRSVFKQEKNKTLDKEDTQPWTAT